MADSETPENNFGSFPLNFHQAVMRLLASTETFPIDLDDAWRWIGWTSKQQAKEVLLNSFIEEVDFLRKGFKSPNGGRPSEWIVLTIDCFKSLAMMASSNRGREVRRYFLKCEAELKRRLEEDRVIQVDLEQQYKAWQQRYDVRLFLKDYLRPELMDAVVTWAKLHKVNPIKLASSVHDAMNERIQGVRSQEMKRFNNLPQHCLIRDHFETRPLIDYAAINKIAKNAIVDHDIEPVRAVHEACDSCLGLSYEPEPVEIVENLYAQERKLKRAKKQRQISQAKQLSIWDQQNEAC